MEPFRGSYADNMPETPGAHHMGWDGLPTAYGRSLMCQWYRTTKKGFYKGLYVCFVELIKCIWEIEADRVIKLLLGYKKNLNQILVLDATQLLIVCKDFMIS